MIYVASTLSSLITQLTKYLRKPVRGDKICSFRQGYLYSENYYVFWLQCWGLHSGWKFGMVHLPVLQRFD